MEDQRCSLFGAWPVVLIAVLALVPFYPPIRESLPLSVQRALLLFGCRGCNFFQGDGHTPIPDVYSCPAYGIIPWVRPLAPLPEFDLRVLDSTVNFEPARGNYDFCAYADMVFCSMLPLGDIKPQAREFAHLVQCLNMDINGPPDLEATIPPTGNGIPDALYELRILERVLNDAAEPLHTIATEIFETNFQIIKDMIVEAADRRAPIMPPFGNIELIESMVPHLVSSLSGILSALATLDDAQTYEALDEMISFITVFGVEAPEEGVAAITYGLPAVGPLGDADGDGFTNREEYEYFVGVLSFPAALYVDAALDPDMKPPAGWRRSK